MIQRSCMSFLIQVSNPIVLNVPGEVVDDLSEAIQSIFPMETERAFIIWNYTCIPLSYRYDISIMIDDIIPMCSMLINQVTGSYKVNFGSNTFNTSWSLSWSENELSILASWNNVTGNLDELVLSTCRRLETKVDSFLSEWKELLSRIAMSVKSSGIQMVDSESYESMLKTKSEIKAFGCLYQEYRDL